MAASTSLPCVARSAFSPLCLTSRARPTTFSSYLTRCRRPARHNRFPARVFSVSAQALVKKYSEDHEWIELDQDGKTGTLGVSTYAAKALGDVVYVELPQPDTEVSAGDIIGAVESVKSASDILTPVAGTVTESNSMLEEKPGTINKSPEGDGWIAKIQLADGDAAMEGLMDSASYDKFTGEQDPKS